MQPYMVRERESFDELAPAAETHASRSPGRAVPIIVEVESATYSHPSHEEFLQFVFRQPLILAKAIPGLLLGGNPAESASLGEKAGISHHPVPLREDLIQWLSAKSALGHAIFLSSAGFAEVSEELSQRICGGEASQHLTGVPTGPARAGYLQRHFPDGFIYVGGSRTDRSVWLASEGIVIAGHMQAAARAAESQGRPVLAQFPNPQLTVTDVLKAFRAHHWSKNLLLFLPLILSHQWHNVQLVLQTAGAFLCLLAVTSATYLLNDLADLKADRLHWTKRNRALASGRMPVSWGLALAMALLAAGMTGALLISAAFAAVLFTYIVLTCAYSARLKSIPLLDTLIIGLLFTLRLFMGCVLIENPKPAWLLTFSVFFFFSLAVAKRHTEVLRAAGSAAPVLKSRGYQPEDSPLTLVLGVGAALASLVVFFIFILLEMLPANVYGRPEFLFTIPIVLSIWMGRIWLLAHRGHMTDDPVSFALRDRCSLLLGAAAASAFILAL